MINKKIKYIIEVLDDVLNEDLNARIRFQNHNKLISSLCIKTNNVIEKLQKENEKRISNENSRKKMISNISHDLRTPLTSMLGYMELILEDENIDQDKKNNYLNIIYSKANSLYNLMEEFFQVSKLDSSDIKVDIKRINLSEIIRQSIISFFAKFQKLNIEPKINIGDKDIFILSDEKALTRILNNLINNALKHASKADKIGIDLFLKQNYIFIDVWDNGAGIPKDQIKFVFDRLYTVEKSRNSALKSSGLGLTIVKKLTELIGADISLQSEPFVKTVFTIRIPDKFRD